MEKQINNVLYVEKRVQKKNNLQAPNLHVLF